MQGSFEKRVQEKLDELKLTPSAPVWEKIELQTSNKKKRRKGLLWIPLLILLFLGAGWWLLQQNTGKPAATVSEAIIPSAETQTNLPELERAEKENMEPVISETPEQTIKPQNSVTGRRNNDRNKTTPLSFSVKQRVVERSNRNRLQKIIDKEQNTKKSITKLLNEKIPNGRIDKNNTTSENESSTENEHPVAADSLVQNKTVQIDSLVTPVNVDTVAAKPKVASLNKKWRIALSAQAGWSSPASALSSSARLDYSSPVQNNSGGFTNNAAYPNGSSGNRAFAVGVGLSRAISSRLQFGFGLSYHTFRSQTQVGSFRPLDTMLRYQSALVDVGGYYRNGNQQDFTTRTSVLELPVSLDYKLFRSLPLYLSAGGAYGRLLKSNALTFDRTSNVYYQNEQNLRKHQFSLFSSVQYAILTNKTFSLRAGPVVHYQLTSFQKQTGTSSQRLLFAGVKTTIEL